MVRSFCFDHFVGKFFLRPSRSFWRDHFADHFSGNVFSSSSCPKNINNTGNTESSAAMVSAATYCSPRRYPGVGPYQNSAPSTACLLHLNCERVRDSNHCRSITFECIRDSYFTWTHLLPQTGGTVCPHRNSAMVPGVGPGFRISVGKCRALLVGMTSWVTSRPRQLFQAYLQHLIRELTFYAIGICDTCFLHCWVMQVAPARIIL